jgi:hypothetical protein
MRRILRYIKHTLQCEIFYEAKNQLQVHGYMDVDWADNVLYRRSTNGFMFSFGNGAVTWNSKKQPTVALLQPHFEGSVRLPLTLPKMELGSPPGTPKNSKCDYRNQNTSH